MLLTLEVRGAGPPVELEGEQEVGQLALPVGPPLLVGLRGLEVVEVDPPELVRVAGHRDHAGPGTQGSGEQPGEGEVAEVVGAELHLEPVGGLPPGDGHHAGVVDQDVEPVGMRAGPPGGEPTHAGEVREVQLGHLERCVRGGGPDLLHRCRTARAVPDRQRHVRPVGSKGLGGLEADPGVGTGHDDRSSGEVRDVRAAPCHDPPILPPECRSRPTGPRPLTACGPRCAVRGSVRAGPHKRRGAPAWCGGASVARGGCWVRTNVG